MKIGVSTASMYGKLYTEDALQWLGDHGIPVAEVFLSSFCEYEPAFGEKLRGIQKDTGIKVHSIHTLNSQFEGQLFAHSQRQKQDAFAIFKNALEIGGMLGAEVYVMHGPGQIKYTKYTTDYPFYAEVTQELAELAAQYGIKLTWENVHWANYNHPFFMRNMRPFLKDEPAVYNTLDIKQANQSHYLIDDYIEDMQGHIANVHVTDIDEDGRLVLPGKGNFDFKSFFHRLHSAGADVPVMIEVYDGCYKELTELLGAYAYLKAIQV